MEYTVQKLARMAGISSRTLRYYDETGLLKPARINSSGYRIYGQNEVDRLQQILFFRELGFDLNSIKDIIIDPAFDSTKALYEHRLKLYKRREQLDDLIANVEKTIAMREGKIIMSDQEKFEGFKRQLLEENEKQYGEEIREKYGEDAVNRSNQKFRNMTKVQYDEVNRLSSEYMQALGEAFKIGDPGCELAQRAADLHRQWLGYFWDGYTPEAHMGLAQMYVEDERFRANYDSEQSGTAAFLRDAIRIYTGSK
ncbi:MAG: MerR family transcriptional regulator [Syntrophomonadaceae bacterium]|nr:MerR family transcriptional regulator [Syntrophomonadaceae bacterium]